MMKTHILLEESPIYNDAMEVGELIWDWVSNWDAFAKHTVGNQIVRSADSIAANFAEGYGRVFFK